MQAKMDFLWSKIARNYIILPISSDPRLWLMAISAFQCVEYLYMASKQKAANRDPYEVLIVLQFFTAMVDLATLILVLIKSPALSTLYSNKKATYVPVPLLAGSKWVNLVPFCLEVFKIIYTTFFTAVLLRSGDISTLNTVVISITTGFYLLVAIFAGLLMSWERWVHYDDWYSMDDHPSPSFVSFSSPLSLTKVPTFSIPTAALTSYFRGNSTQADLGQGENSRQQRDLDDNAGEDDGLLSTKRDRIMSDSYDINLDPIKHSPLLVSDDEDGIVMHIDLGNIATNPTVGVSSSSTESALYSPPTISLGSNVILSDDELP